MALPPLLRPSYVIRRKALRRGVLGPSTFWKIVAVFVLGRQSLKRVFGKNPEVVATERLAMGEFVRVAAIRPMTRRERRRDPGAKARLVAQAHADVAAARSAT